VDATAADQEGRIWVTYTGRAEPPVKVQVRLEGGETPYNYDLPADGTPIALPLTQGEGSYTVTVLEHIEADRYRPVLTQPVELALADPLAPFRHPSRMVDYGADMEALAAACMGEAETTPDRIEAILHYVAEHITYDTEKADTVESGYIPDPHAVLEAGTGICYDYASALTALLRSQGIPCKLQVGWAGELYHAWVEVWSEEAGTAANGLQINEGWTRLDPTLLSDLGFTPTVLTYMADDTHYRVRYTY